MAGVNRIIWGAEGSDEFYGFDDLLGALQPKSNQLVKLVRPGRPGERILSTGLRAPESRVRSRLFVENLATAVALLEDYVALKDGLPYEVKQNGVSYSYFKVLDVIPLPFQACAATVGTLVANPTVLMEVDWILVNTEPPA